MGGNKPAGLRAGRKLRLHRKEQRWAKKSFASKLILITYLCIVITYICIYNNYNN